MEYWSDRERTKLNVIEIRCLRFMCRVMHMDRVRNEEMHEKTGFVRVSSLRKAESVAM